MVIAETYRYQNFAKKTPDMRPLTTTVLVSLAAVLLVLSGNFIHKVDFQIHQNPFVNGLAKYQLFAVLIGMIAVIFILITRPESQALLSIGELSTIATKEKWLGINGKSTWLNNGLQLLIGISLATGIFMFLGVNYTNSLNNFHWWFMPYVLLFSLTNSFTEEMIFRFAVIAGLENYCSKFIILIISAVIFGLPHYFGNPSGIIGVIMSGALGYILCKATIETKGISIAWIIHFVQDIIIFTAIMMMNTKP
ncbi:MAG: CPBP family intramembrane metalloprotease [Cytophagales bacterium]|nr:MAG: CPBP family intramembrane metalloprotease [Cytophagales bacterium]TAF62248.1 MAG: CPBP family intramembrane metalloprotease [Cytophagales bacterium]